MATTTILTVQNLGRRFVTELIFSGITFQVNENEHVALVGSNGAGKSTLLRIIGGIDHPSEGNIIYANGLRMAYQAQEATFREDRTLLEEGLDAFREVRNAADRMTQLEQDMTNADAEALDAMFEEYSTCSTYFEAHGGYEMEYRTQQVLSGLGFSEEMFNHPVRQLSGGQKTRVALAKALLSDPDLLMLDEPTNHLDLQAIEWLEGFLRNWNRAFIVVSHDRYFLDRVTNRTLDMAFGRLEDYPAGYNRYLELREERMARRQKEYEEQQEYINRTEEFIRRYKAGQRSREARGRETRLARLDRIDRPQEHDRLHLKMRADIRSGRVVLSIRPMKIGYRDGDGATPVVLAETDELQIERGERVALIGPNGAGKTTTLRTLVGELDPLKGRAELGTAVKLAYYAQGHEGLNPNRSALDTILHDQPMGDEAARNLLGRFLFSGDDVYKPVSALSGGERSRLALARLTLERANLLVLDEPTNHLDILARETLEDVLDGYDGTMLFVSHDRYFVDAIATRIWAIEDGHIVDYRGNYTEMGRIKARAQATELARQTQAQSNGTVATGAGTNGSYAHGHGHAPAATPQATSSTSAPNGTTAAASGAAASSPDAKDRNAKGQRSQRGNDRTIRDTQKRLQTAERDVSRFEGRLNTLSDDLARASIEGQIDRITELGQEYTTVQEALEQAYDAWNAISAELEALNAELVRATP